MSFEVGDRVKIKKHRWGSPQCIHGKEGTIVSRWADRLTSDGFFYCVRFDEANQYLHAGQQYEGPRIENRHWNFSEEFLIDINPAKERCAGSNRLMLRRNLIKLDGKYYSKGYLAKVV